MEMLKCNISTERSSSGPSRHDQLMLDLIMHCMSLISSVNAFTDKIEHDTATKAPSKLLDRQFSISTDTDASPKAFDDT